MKKLALLLLLLPASAFAQQQVYCNASSQTPCNTTSDAGTGTSGEAAWLSFGKFNANFSTLQSEGLFSSVGSSTPGVLKVANGGTGTATPSLVAGTNVTISGTWPNQTISASGGGSSTTFQVNGTNLSSSTTVNFESSAATNGLTFTFTNPSAGNVQLGLSGWPALVSGDFLTNNGTALSWATALTNFTFTNGNGFTGTVTNPTTTPALSLAPSFTGVAYSSGTALAAATAANIYGVFGCSGSSSTFLNGAGGCTTPAGSGGSVIFHSLSGTAVTLAVNSSSSPAVDVNNLTLSGNSTVTTPTSTAMSNGEILYFKAIQPVSSAFTVTFSAGAGTSIVYEVPGGSCPAVPTTGAGAQAEEVWVLHYNASTTTPQLDVLGCATDPAQTAPMVNPMTTLGDVIVAGASGNPQRLAGNTNPWPQFVGSENSAATALFTPNTLQIVANATTTGTIVDKLTTLTGAPSTAVVASTSQTNGVLGIAIGGAGTTGSVAIQTAGVQACVFDGATTAGDYVQISSTTAGDCHDAGASLPSSGEIIGQVLTTNAAAGTYNLAMQILFAGGAGGSSSWSGLSNPSANLSLSMGSFTSTFNQTSAANWTWANTTAATSSTVGDSPILNLNSTYWNGTASATDSWSLQNILATGTNGTSTLTFSHSGSTGTAAIQVPQLNVGSGGAHLATSGSNFYVVPAAGGVLRIGDGSGDMIIVTAVGGNSANIEFNSPVNMEVAPISVSGTTAGTAAWSEPQQGSNYKQTVLYLNGYENTTATAQTITLPASYATVSYVVTDGGACTGVTIAGATVTLPASMSMTQTGLCEIRGY